MLPSSLNMVLSLVGVFGRRSAGFWWCCWVEVLIHMPDLGTQRFTGFSEQGESHQQFSSFDSRVH
jgi:hypothetical protein